MGDEFSSRFYQPPEPDDDDAQFGPADEDDAAPQIIPPRGGDTRIPNRVLDHEAFKALDPYGVRVYLHLHRLHRHPGKGRDGREWPGNNGRIVLSRYEAGEKCNMHRLTVGKALDALKSAKLIEEMKPARLDGQTWLAPEWRITCLPCIVTGRSPSFAFRRPEPAASRTKSKRE